MCVYLQYFAVSGRVILGLLALGGIDFLRKRLLSKEEEKASTNVHEAKVDYASQLQFDEAKVDYASQLQVHEAKMDYASQLPDDVLSSILSRMTIKDVVKTSILSTRWRYLFASMPTLRFSLDMFGVKYLGPICPPYDQKKFLEVVNQFLQLYLGRKVVELEMHMFIERHLFSRKFAQLMHSISKLDVERLHLNFTCEKTPTSQDIDLPHDAFFEFSLELLSQASSLKSLFLSVCIVRPSVGLRLNSLKTLSLTGVLLETGQLEDILFSCLNLNQLVIKYCKLPHKLCISGTVTSVIFADCGGLEEIDLQATKLSGFECFFDEKVRFYFSSVPVLERIKISLRGDASMPYIFGEFPMSLPAQVKSLIVTACYTQVTHFPTETQIFRDLRMLALLLDSTYDFDIVKVFPILDACPVLQYLDILQHKTYRQNGRGSHTKPPLSPTIHTELKEVRFGGFHGTKEETELAIYILRSATVLDQMFLSQYSINPYFKAYYGHDIWEERERERISIQQQLFEQAISSNAVVIVQ
ncbi:hypothetical protein FXO37_33942 [Capsicum annuum]|nr:hypothetical protein FXO37_33942 [Capsicum annuum]